MRNLLAFQIVSVFVVLGLMSGLTQKIQSKIINVRKSGTPALSCLLVKPRETQKEPFNILVCSHGTNSHKEVFLPLAWELCNRGFFVLSPDSSTLSTDEGIPVKVEEIKSALHVVQNEIGGNAYRISVLGHSDGGPPSLNFYKNIEVNRRTWALLLGSYLSESATPLGNVAGFVGGFDQIFPPEEVKASFVENGASGETCFISWFSDHFTEQYDPFLQTQISNTLFGEKNSFRVFSFGFRVFSLAFGVGVFFFFGVTVFSKLSFWNRLIVLGFSLFLFIFFQDNVWAPTFVLWFFLGGTLGKSPQGQQIITLLVFFLLMTLNVCVSSIFFWKNFSQIWWWVWLGIPWYLISWIAKITLFSFSLVSKFNIAGFENFPVIMLVLATGLAVKPGIISLLLTKAMLSLKKKEGAEIGGSKGYLAFFLFAVMTGLWGIRFLQGFVQAEVLRSVAGNFLRMLVLPTIYISLLLTGRTSKEKTDLK
ncbi:hypothetical protein HYY75_02645 [bacterium]|nr:hypothetical protein [bacterium]